MNFKEKIERKLNQHPQEKFVKEFPWLWVIIKSLFPERWNPWNTTITVDRAMWKEKNKTSNLQDILNTPPPSNLILYIRLMGWNGSQAIKKVKPTARQGYIKAIKNFCSTAIILPIL
jgi:hypothetical protein